MLKRFLVMLAAVLAAVPASAHAGTATLVSSVDVGIEPAGLAVDLQSHRVFVANVHSKDVTVIDGVSRSVVFTIPGAATSFSVPIAVGADGATGRLFVSDRLRNVYVFDANGAALGLVPTGFQPRGIGIDAVARRGYVSVLGSDVVTIFDLDTLSVLGSLPTGHFPLSVAVDESLHRAYVSSLASDTITVVDGVSVSSIATISVSSPTGLAVDTTTGDVFVASQSFPVGVSVFDPSTFQMIRSVDLDRQPADCCLMGLTLDGQSRTVMVSGPDGAVVMTLEAETLEVVGMSRVCLPSALAVDTSLGQVYVLNTYSNSIAILAEGGTAEPPDVIAPRSALESRAFNAPEYVAGSTRWTRGFWNVYAYCRDDLSGCLGGVYVEDDGTHVDGSPTFDLHDERLHSLSYGSFDCAGNRESAQMAKLGIDRTGPQATMNTRTRSVYVTGVSHLSASATDLSLDGKGGSGVTSLCFAITRISALDGTRTAVGCAEAQLAPDGSWQASPDLTTGKYEVAARATDLVGNAGAASAPITIYTAKVI